MLADQLDHLAHERAFDIVTLLACAASSGSSKFTQMHFAPSSRYNSCRHIFRQTPRP